MKKDTDRENSGRQPAPGQPPLKAYTEALAKGTGQPPSAAGDHKQIERALQRALEREKILGRLRQRTLSLNSLSELENEIKHDFLTDLRRIGIALFSASVQLPASKPDHFSTTTTEVENFLVWEEHPIARFPWVGKAWETGQPQIVGCDQFAADTLPFQVKEAIEIPLSGGGSMGVSSTETGVFDNADTRQILQSCADLIDLAVSRFQRQIKVNLEHAELAIHRSVLEMKAEEDFMQVIRTVAQELARLGLDYEAVGANIFDAQGASFITYVYFKKGMRPHLSRQNKPVDPELLSHFRRNQVWERPRPDNFVFKTADARGGTYNPGTIIDVPFAYGTLAIGLNSPVGLHGRLIQLLQTFCGLLEIGFARAQDMARRQAAEEALAQRAEELARSNQELEQFAYVASHDLQEPLRMISSYLELLNRKYQDKLDDKARQYIHYAVDGAQRMQQLILDLLQLSRIGNQGNALAPTDIAQVLASVIADLQLAIESNNATVELEPLPTVLADAQQMGQLFRNLIGNALKFRGDRPPQIRIGAERQNDKWVFSVADNGIGMAPENAERIFQIFQRLHTREAYEGTGIGLAICKKIVERHSGRIWAESTPGEGTVFYFTLPADQVETT